MRTIKLGNVHIDRVVEMSRWIFNAKDLLPAVTQELLEEGRGWLDEHHIHPNSNDLILGSHSFLIRINGRIILVDTCNGNHKNRPSLLTRNQLDMPYLANLKAAGISPEDVDVVLCTHLHPDHCGWNTRLSDEGWIPTFPNARYLINSAEFERVKKICTDWQRRSVFNDMVAMFSDSILPIIQANQVDLVSADHVVMQGIDGSVWLENASGHTPGHVFVHVKCNQYHAIMTGDVIHHPIQLMALDVANASDFDPGMAAITRRKFIESYANTSTIILSGHFAGSTAGRIITKEDTFRFQWLNDE